MPGNPNFSRQLGEQADSIYISFFTSGLFTNKSPLYTPLTSLGLQVIARHDVLADGLNMELTPIQSIARRPGFSRYCSVAFGSSDYPLAFYSFQNLSGTIKQLVDTPTKIYSFTSSSLSSIFTKGTTAQTQFQKVGNTCYAANGTDLIKYDGSSVSTWGISAPLTAPTLSFTAGSLTSQVGWKYVYVFKNSSTGHISSASPISASTGVIASQNVVLSGSRSTDGQVDKVDIYRNNDGGSVYNFLAEVANPVGGTWTYTDSTVDAGLNDFIHPAMNHENDPPPSGTSLAIFHMGRFFVASGNVVTFSGGPDITNGVPEESFPPANDFKFPGKVTAFASTTAGLLVFTSDNAYIIRGVDTASFYSSVWFKNFGVTNQNCLIQDGDLLYVYTMKRQLFEFSDSLKEIGNSIADKLLASFNPANSYLALHRSGADSGLFISNGIDSIYRFSVTGNNWSPLCQPVGGVKAIASMENITNDWTLFLGRATGSGYILNRNLSVFQDDGSNYAAYMTLGSLVLKPIGQLAHIESILIDRMPTGSDSTIAVLMNEISGSFVELPTPPAAIGVPSLISPANSIISRRHFLKNAQTPLILQARHMQIKVSFSPENSKNEILGLCIQ